MHRARAVAKRAQHNGRTKGMLPIWFNPGIRALLDLSTDFAMSVKVPADETVRPTDISCDADLEPVHPMDTSGLVLDTAWK